MKQYLLSIYQPDDVKPAPEVLEKVMRDANALIEDAKAAGVWVFNGGLHPPSAATVVRLQRGSVLITDGPFTEAKEHIGGFLVIKVPDLESALDWARRIARAVAVPDSGGVHSGLAIEVRPFYGEAGAGSPACRHSTPPRPHVCSGCLSRQSAALSSRVQTSAADVP